MKITKLEREILEATKEFAKSNNIHYSNQTELLILNAIREVSFRGNRKTFLDFIETLNKR